MRDIAQIPGSHPARTSGRCARPAPLVFRRRRRAAAVTLALVGAALPALRPASAQVTTWIGPSSESWSLPTNWSAGMPNGAGFTALVDDGSPQSSNVLVNGNFTVGTLSISAGDQVTVDNNRTLVVASLLNNLGTLMLASGANSATLSSGGGSFVASGGGHIVLSGPNAVVGNNGTFTNADNTINGQGSIAGNGMFFTNQGTVNANVNGGSIFIDPVGAGMSNSGTLTASNGGLLRLNGQFGGGVNNAGGTISAQNGSSVSLENNISITGGTFTTSGSGVFRTAAGATVHIASINHLGNWTLDNNSDTHYSGDLFNTGSININAVGSTTRMLFNSGTTNLTGGGTINLGSTGAGEATIGGGNGRLVNVNNLIRGSGVIGANSQRFTNAAGGIVQADVPGVRLFIDPIGEADGFVNNGVMRAANGGLLQFSGQFSGGVTNGGTISASGAGSEVQLLGSIGISGGTFTTSAGGAVRTVAGQTVFVSGTSNLGDWTLDNNSDTHYSGDFFNSGSVNVNAGTHTTRMLFNAGTTNLTGGGTINLGSSGAGRATVGGGTGRLVNVNNAIRGFGDIGANSQRFTNAAGGTVSADVAGQAIFIDPIGEADGFVNAGTMQASNGGALQFHGQFTGGVNNIGGRIIANSASQVQLLGMIGITGGTFSTAGTGSVNVAAGHTAFLHDVANTGAMVVTNNADLQATGLLTNAGSITLSAAAASGARLGSNGGSLTLGGGGTVVMTDTGAAGRAVFGFTAGTITVGAAQTVRGTGNIASNNNAIVNNGTINADQTGKTIFVDPVAGPHGFINNNRMMASNGGALQLSGQFTGGVTNNGTISATGAASLVQLQHSVGVTGGTFTSSAGGAVEAQAGHSVVIAENTNTGTLNVQDGATLNVGGTIANHGTINLNAGASEARLTSTGGVTVINGTGTILMNAGTASAVVGQGGGTLDLSQTIAGRGRLASNNGAIINRGSIIARGGGEIFVDPQGGVDTFLNLGTMRVETGSQLQFNGQFTGGVNNTGGHIDVDAGGTLLTNNSHALSGGTITLDGTWNATNSSVTTVTSIRGTGTLNLSNSARVNIAAGGGTAGTSRVAGITAATSGRLDLNDHDFIVDYSGASPIQTVRQLLQGGFNNGNWNGTGIVSSNATANTHGIGYAEATSLFTSFPATFSGQQVDDTSVLLHLTRFGDADLNNIVNLGDFNRLANNFGTPSNATWLQGDFNYDGVVNLSDFNLLANNFGLSAGPDGVADPADWAALVAAVPEPATMAVAAPVAAAALLQRRRRRR